jgi:acetyl-CoA synthetase
VRTLTYIQLHREVCLFANALKSLGVRPGDRVAIYMPMVPEAAVAMLACARLGATHSVVFGGFSAEALRDRIQDAEAKVVVTADGGWRKGAALPLKESVDAAVRGRLRASPLHPLHLRHDGKAQGRRPLDGGLPDPGRRHGPARLRLERR